jgi:hypothetical protein
MHDAIARQPKRLSTSLRRGLVAALSAIALVAGLSWLSPAGPHGLPAAAGHATLDLDASGHADFLDVARMLRAADAAAGVEVTASDIRAFVAGVESGRLSIRAGSDRGPAPERGAIASASASAGVAPTEPVQQHHAIGGATPSCAAIGGGGLSPAPGALAETRTPRGVRARGPPVRV